MIHAKLDNAKALNHLREIVNKVGVAMMSTNNAQGHPKACPMHTLDFDEHGAVWFYTFVDSEKVVDGLSDSNIVNLIYSKPEKGIYVSLTGPTYVLNDPAKIRKYWQDRFKAWIPDGPDSKGLRLLKVSVIEGESWDIDTNKVVRFLKETKARISGEFIPEASMLPMP